MDQVDTLALHWLPQNVRGATPTERTSTPCHSLLKMREKKQRSEPGHESDSANELGRERVKHVARRTDGLFDERLDRCGHPRCRVHWNQLP